MKLSELEVYVAVLRSYVTQQGKEDVEITFSLHRNICGEVMQTSKGFLYCQPKPITAPLHHYTGGSGEDSFRFIMPMESVDISGKE